MNRIRKIGDTYQVLITPSIVSDASIGLMYGNWTDADLKGFCIKAYDDLADAQCEALRLPDINWKRIVSSHVDFFKDIKQKVSNLLDKYNLIYEMKATIVQPDDLKNTLFDRVIKFGDRFSLSHHMNDIISIHGHQIYSSCPEY